MQFLARQGTARIRDCYPWQAPDEEAEMSRKDKSETDEKRKKDEKSDELERELEDSFPASDPPSLTQPNKSGAPDHKGDKAK
jgi:hypothetical protein